MTALRTLDLFSGIGALSLGLERTGGFETVAFCEIEPFCQRLLAKHWPAVPVHSDVRELRGPDVAPIDVICAGFPCQDISFAGKGKGLAGERSGLFYEVARLVGELRPRVVILENVAALLRRGLGAVLGELAALGYDAEWDCIPAAYLGAPHRRDRIWIVAYQQGDALGPYADGIGSYRQTLHQLGSAQFRDKQVGDAGSLAWWRAEPRVQRVVDGAPGELDVARLKAIGNAVFPDIPELIGRAILASINEQQEAA